MGIVIAVQIVVPERAMASVGVLDLGFSPESVELLAAAKAIGSPGKQPARWIVSILDGAVRSGDRGDIARIVAGDGELVGEKF
jgi:hypothetical protein